MAGRKSVGGQSLIELGRRSGTSGLPGTPGGERRAKASNFVDLDETDPYTFVGSQSLQIQGNKSNTMSKPKQQTTLIHYSTSSSSTPASMRSVKITNSRKGETTPVNANKGIHPKSAGRTNKAKRSPAALTERERLEMKEKEELERALEASLQSSKREERHRRRIAGDGLERESDNVGSRDSSSEGRRSTGSEVVSKERRNKRVSGLTAGEEKRSSGMEKKLVQKREDRTPKESGKEREKSFKENVRCEEEVSLGNRSGGMKPLAMKREGSKIRMKIRKTPEEAKHMVRGKGGESSENLSDSVQESKPANISGREGAFVRKEISVKKEIPVKKEISVKEEIPVKKEIFVKKETPVKKEISVKEETPVKKEISVKEEISMKEEIFVKSEISNESSHSEVVSERKKKEGNRKIDEFCDDNIAEGDSIAAQGSKLINEAKRPYSSEDIASTGGQIGLSMFAKSIEEESDSEAEYSTVTASNKVSGHMTSPSSDRGSPAGAPVIISEGEGKAQDSSVVSSRSSFPSPVKPTVNRPNLKSVSLSRLKLKKSSTEVVKLEKEPTPQQEDSDKKGSATPKLENKSPFEDEKKPALKQSGKGQMPSNTKKHLVAKKGTRVKTEGITSVNEEPDRFADLCTPPLGSTSVFGADTKTDKSSSSRKQLSSKRNLFQASPSAEEAVNAQQQQLQGKPPSSRSNLREVDESMVEDKRKDVTILSVPAKDTEHVKQSDKDKTLVLDNTSSMSIMEPPSVEQSVSINSDMKTSKKLSLSKSSLSKTKTTPTEKKSMPSKTSPKSLSSISPPADSLPVESPAEKECEDSVMESSCASKESGAARTRVLASLTLKRAFTIPSSKPTQTQSVEEESQNTFSYKPASRGATADEDNSVVGGGNNNLSRKRRLSKESTETNSRKKSKLEGISPTTSSTPIIEQARHLEPKNVEKSMSKPPGAGRNTAAPTGVKHKAYSPPLFFARDGIDPGEYSKVILDSLNTYISLLADAQSKVWSRIRWGKPISMAPRSSSQISLRRSIRKGQPQEWKYALKLNSNPTDNESGGHSLDQTSGCGEGVALGVLCDTVEEDKGVEIMEVVAQPAVNTQETDCNTSAEDQFIPLISYHEDSDNVEDSKKQDKVKLSSATPASERTSTSSVPNERDVPLKSASSSPTTGQLKPFLFTSHKNKISGSSNDVTKELLPQDTQETFLESHFDEDVVETGMRGVADVQKGSSGPITNQTPSRTSSALKQKKIVRKRLLNDSDKSTSVSSESEREDLLAEKQDSQWLDSRSSGHNRSTPHAKRSKITKQPPSKKKRSGESNVAGVLGRQKGKKMSAAARLILSKEKSAGSANSLLKRPPTGKVHENSREVGVKKLSGLLSSDSEDDTPPKHTVPASRELGTSGKKKSVSKRIIEKHLPSNSDSDFDQPAQYHDAMRKKTKGNSTIDLTELTEKVTLPNSANKDSMAESEDSDTAVRDLQRCPICKKMFDKKDLSKHTDQCVKTPTGKKKNLSKCATCGNMFESSVISVHVDQCGVTSSDEDTAPLPRVWKDNVPSKTKEVSERTGGVTGRRKTSGIGLAALRGSPSDEIDDKDSDDGVIEISDDDVRQDGGSSDNQSILRDLSRSSSPSLIGVANSTHQHLPRAVPCDDGGFVVENSGSVPISTFTRLQDMDWKERERYQNQFKKKSGSRQSRYLTGVPSKSRGSGKSEWSKAKKGGGVIKKNGKSKLSHKWRKKK